MSHDYRARVIWEGNSGDGTLRYTGYGRQYRVLVSGKPDLTGSADPAFRGEPDKLRGAAMKDVAIALENRKCSTAIMTTS